MYKVPYLRKWVGCGVVVSGLIVGDNPIPLSWLPPDPQAVVLGYQATLAVGSGNF